MPSKEINNSAVRLAIKLLGRQPQVSFKEGLRRTFEWYFATKDQEQVRRLLGGGALMERKVESVVA